MNNYQKYLIKSMVEMQMSKEMIVFHQEKSWRLNSQENVEYIIHLPLDNLMKINYSKNSFRHYHFLLNIVL